MESAIRDNDAPTDGEYWTDRRFQRLIVECFFCFLGVVDCLVLVADHAIHVCFSQGSQNYIPRHV